MIVIIQNSLSITSTVLSIFRNAIVGVLLLLSTASNRISVTHNSLVIVSNSLSTYGNGIQKSGKTSRSGGCAISKDVTIKKKTNKSISTLDFYLSTNWRIIQ